MIKVSTCNKAIAVYPSNMAGMKVASRHASVLSAQNPGVTVSVTNYGITMFYKNGKAI